MKQETETRCYCIILYIVRWWKYKVIKKSESILKFLFLTVYESELTVFYNFKFLAFWLLEIFLKFQIFCKISDQILHTYI